MKKSTKERVEKLLTTDARFKVFKEKLKKLGYVKAETAKVKQDGEVRTDDMKKIKVKNADAVKVHDALMSVRAPARTKYLQLLQKNKTSFDKTFKAILKAAS